MKNPKGFIWLVTFLLLFLLTQDYLFTNWTNRPTLLGLPDWLWWFVAIHVLFVVCFYFFAQRYWK